MKNVTFENSALEDLAQDLYTDMISKAGGYEKITDEKEAEFSEKADKLAPACWTPTQEMVDDFFTKYPFLQMTVHGYEPDNYVDSVRITVIQQDKPSSELEPIIVAALDTELVCYTYSHNIRDAVSCATIQMKKAEIKAEAIQAERGKDYTVDMLTGTIIGLIKRMERDYDCHSVTVDVDYQTGDTDNKAYASMWYNDNRTCTRATAKTKKLALLALEQLLSKPDLKLVS